MALTLGLLWAVLAAVATNMVLGMAWYGPLFGKRWMRAMGIEDLSEEETQQMQKEAMPGYAVSMVGAVVATVILWFGFDWAAAAPEGYSDWLKGLVLGFSAWLGFYLLPSATMTFFEDKDRTVWAIGAGYWGVLALLYGVYVGVFHAF